MIEQSSRSSLPLVRRLPRPHSRAAGSAAAPALAAIAAVGALLATAPVAHAAPSLANPVLVAQAGETVICIATNVSKIARPIEIFLSNGAGTVVAAEEHTVEPFKSAAVSFVNGSNLPGLFVCEVDLKGSAKRTFRARIKTPTDQLLVN